MSIGSTVGRAARFIVHNWPLKLAAIGLATLLYAGLVASQDSITFPGPVPVTAINKPVGTEVTNNLRDIDQIRYVAPPDVPRQRPRTSRRPSTSRTSSPTGSRSTSASRSTRSTRG